MKEGVKSIKSKCFYCNMMYRELCFVHHSEDQLYSTDFIVG